MSKCIAEFMGFDRCADKCMDPRDCSFSFAGDGAKSARPAKFQSHRTVDYQRGWDDCLKRILLTLGEKFPVPVEEPSSLAQVEGVVEAAGYPINGTTLLEAVKAMVEDIKGLEESSHRAFDAGFKAAGGTVHKIHTTKQGE